MSNTFNNWRKIGGINRSADHNIVRTPVSINNNLNITDIIGTTNSDTILYGNLNVYGNIDVSGSVSFHTIDFSGNITCDNLDVNGTITCDTLDVSGTITCDTLDVNGTITCDTLDVSGTITCDTLDVSGTITCDALDVSGNITFNTLDVTGTITCDSLDVNGAITTSYTSLPTFPNNAIGYHYIQSSYIVQTNITLYNTTITNFTFPKAGVYLLFIDVYIVTGNIITDQGLWNITTNAQTSSDISWSNNSFFNSNRYCSPGYYSTIINATADSFNESIGIQLDVGLFGSAVQITEATCLYRYVKIA